VNGEVAGVALFLPFAAEAFSGMTGCRLGGASHWEPVQAATATRPTQKGFSRHAFWPIPSIVPGCEVRSTGDIHLSIRAGAMNNPCDSGNCWAIRI